MLTKAPVVLVHGMWSTPDALKDVRAAFEEEGYQVHVPRLPYHLPRNELRGATLDNLANASIEDYVNCIAECLNELDQKPILVGHSMGGLLAQLVAMNHDCERLVLISSAPPAGINAWKWSVLRTFGHNLFKFPLWRKATNLLLKNVQYGIANTQSADIHKEIIQTATYESGRASWQISMWFFYRNPPTRVHYEKINCPVLLISGTEDKITPISLQDKLVRKYRGNAQLKKVEGACHWTVGGSFFPEIKAGIFTWLGHDQARSA